jgi:hypothetical protein
MGSLRVERLGLVRSSVSAQAWVAGTTQAAFLPL